MTVDEIARRAGAELREDVLLTTDVERGLVALERTARRHRQTRVAAGAVAAVAVVAVGVPAFVAGQQGPGEVPGPAPADRSSADGCSLNPAISCPGPGRVRVSGPSAYELVLPDGFTVPQGQALAPGLVDVYVGGHRAGVTVLQDALGAGLRSRPDGARGMASWIASRPFLETSAPARTVVDGRTAWVVDVRLAPGALGRPEDRCNGEQTRCRRLLYSAADPLGWEIGPWVDRLSRYYCVDAPGRRVTVLWSWAFEDEGERALARNDALVRSFSLARQ